MTILKLLILLCTISIFAFETNITTLTKLYNDNKAVGLDVRSTVELKDNPAEGALHISINDLNSKSLSKLERNKEIFIFCESGYRAEKAKGMMSKLGYKNVINIKDWRTWNKLQSSLNK